MKLSLTTISALTALTIITSNITGIACIAHYQSQSMRSLIHSVAALDHTNRMRGTIHTAYMLSSSLIAESKRSPTADLQTRLNQAGTDNLIPDSAYVVITEDKVSTQRQINPPGANGNLVPISQFHYPIRIQENSNATIFDTVVPTEACLTLKNVTHDLNSNNINAVCFGAENENHAKHLKITLFRPKSLHI